MWIRDLSSFLHAPLPTSCLGWKYADLLCTQEAITLLHTVHASCSVLCLLVSRFLFYCTYFLLLLVCRYVHALYLYIASRNQTWVTRFVQQVPLLLLTHLSRFKFSSGKMWPYCFLRQYRSRMTLSSDLLCLPPECWDVRHFLPSLLSIWAAVSAVW